MMGKPSDFEGFIGKYFTKGACPELFFNSTSSTPPPSIDELLKLKKKWLAMVEGDTAKKVWLPGGTHFEYVAPKPKYDHWDWSAYKYIGIDYGNGEPSAKVVKIPGGYAIAVNLEEHHAHLKRKHEEDFEGGLSDLQAASAAWGTPR